ncbi:unnamed protein product [Closterium sp. NIES-54]
MYLKNAILDMGCFDILSKDVGVPLVTFALKEKDGPFNEYDIADVLKQFGWIIPAYTMAPDLEHVTMLRALVREDFSRSLADRFLNDVRMTLKILEDRGATVPRTVTPAAATAAAPAVSSIPEEAPVTAEVPKPKSMMARDLAADEAYVLSPLAGTRLMPPNKLEYSHSMDSSALRQRTFRVFKKNSIAKTNGATSSLHSLCVASAFLFTLTTASASFRSCHSDPRACKKRVVIACSHASHHCRFCWYQIPKEGIPKEAAYQMIHDELLLDCNPRLNLASFVTTWMEPECDQLIMESLNKNYINIEEYPVTNELQVRISVQCLKMCFFFVMECSLNIVCVLVFWCSQMQERCVNIIANLFNAPLGDGEGAIGAGCVGSSEAIMLAGLASKRKWQEKRKAEGKPYDKPNFVCGSEVQVCWEKFSNYFEVETKFVNVKEGSFVMDPHDAVEAVDENTICICGILGSTYNGEFEDIKLLNDLLVEKNAKTGWDTPIHVDAASGGFVAPFLYPDLEWDFRLPTVRSINVSGHKFGLVYPGVGWVVWRSKADLPEDLIFHVNYLGADQPTFTLNFSKGALRWDDCRAIWC